MRTAVALLVACSGLAASASAIDAAGGAGPATSRIVDRTMACTVMARAAVRAVEVSASVGVRLREDRSKWRLLASAGVGDAAGSFAGVSAGNPLADLEPGFVAPPFRAYVAAAERCKPVARRPFSRSGLAGEVPSPLTSRYDCVPGRRVLVRLRAEFAAPVSLRPRRFAGGVVQLVAAGTVTRGQLAVQSAAGKPLAYAEVFESGRARLFVSNRCVPD